MAKPVLVEGSPAPPTVCKPDTKSIFVSGTFIGFQRNWLGFGSQPDQFVFNMPLSIFLYCLWTTAGRTRYSQLKKKEISKSRQISLPYCLITPSFSKLIVRALILGTRCCKCCSGQLFSIQATWTLLWIIHAHWQRIRQRLSGMMVSKTRQILVLLMPRRHVYSMSVQLRMRQKELIAEANRRTFVFGVVRPPNSVVFWGVILITIMLWATSRDLIFHLFFVFYLLARTTTLFSNYRLPVLLALPAASLPSGLIELAI